MPISKRVDDITADRRMKFGKVFLFLSLCLILLFAGVALINSSLFYVRTVHINGLKFMSEEELLSIAHIPRNINIFRVDSKAIVTELKQDLRIEQANITRRFPSEIILTIVERRPAVYVASSYGFLQIDKQGVVLTATKTIRKMHAPMLTGIVLGNAYVGDKISQKEIVLILKYLVALDDYAFNEIAEINRVNTEKLIIYTLHSGLIHLQLRDDLPTKADLTNQVLHEIAEKKLSVDYVDLTYTSPYIKFKK